jgi:hypothetical protein
MCSYEAAIVHFRNVAADLQMQEYDDKLGGIRCCSVDRLDREMMLFDMRTWYRKLNKWDQSIEALHKLCLPSTRTGGTMLPQANEALAQTYLAQYCTDTALNSTSEQKFYSTPNAFLPGS